MATTDSRSTYDTYTAEAFPDANRGDWQLLRLRGPGGSQQFAYVYFPGVPPAGATALSATLSVWLRGANWSGGPHTLTAKLINAVWHEDKLTWNRSGAGQMADPTPAASASVTGGVDGQRVDIDVSAHLAAVAAGHPWYGIRVEVDTADDFRDLYSSEAPRLDVRPELVVEWSRPPSAPTDVAPSGGRSTSLALPTLTWRFTDPDGDAQQAFQVQIAAASTVDSSGAFVAAEHDSGWVTSALEQYDLSGTAYVGLADAAVRYWIVRTRDEYGLASDWSDPVEFRRDVKGSLVIDSPLDGGTVEETTPAITTTLTGRAQEAIAYRLWEDDGTGRFVSLWATGRFVAEAADGVPSAFAVPAGLIKRTGRDYKIDVWSYDTIDREATPGDPLQVAGSATFTFIQSAVPAAVTSLAVADETPGVKLTWSRAAGVSAPDFWALVVDGVRVFDRIDPAAVQVGGDPIVYEMLWYGAAPNIAHTIEIEAVVDDAGTLKHSQGNVTQLFTVDLTEVGGVWLVDDAETPYTPAGPPRTAWVRGGDVPDLQIGQSSATFYVVGRSDPVLIVDAIRGREGTISGTVGANPYDDPGSDGFLANFAWMTQLPGNIGRRIRLIFGDVNIPVQLGQASDTHMDSHLRRHQVSVEVSQIGEFEQAT